MDLGLQGRTAIVCAASKGLGRACAEALAAEGVALVLNARTAGPLEQTAEELRTKYKVDGDRGRRRHRQRRRTAPRCWPPVPRPTSW